MIRRINKFFLSMAKYTVLSMVSLFSLFPFYWMISVSLQSEKEAVTYPPVFFTGSPQWKNYVIIFENKYMANWLLNSFIVSIIETIIILFVSVFSAYWFFYTKKRYKAVVMFFCFLVSSIPFEVVMAFNYQLFVKLSLVDTLVAVFLPFLANFFYSLIIFNSFKSIPNTLYISAMLSGTSNVKYIFKIALPLIKPTVIFVGIISFVSSWNSFLWAAIITNSEKCRTLPFGVYNYMSDIGARKELVMAISVIMAIPPIVLFAVTRKSFVKGFKKGF